MNIASWHMTDMGDRMGVRRPMIMADRWRSP